MEGDDGDGELDRELVRLHCALRRLRAQLVAEPRRRLARLRAHELQKRGAACGAGGVGAALRATAGSATGGADVGVNDGTTIGGGGVAVLDSIAANANGATWWLDCVECAPPSWVAASGATAPAWRGGEPPEATFAPTTWTAATGPITLRDDGTVPPDPADEEDQAEELGAAPAEQSATPQEKQEKRRARAMTRAADPIASMLLSLIHI